ncbi:hypothetical protein GCM10007190_08240 [Macrococcus hajekii]|nr:N-6 DNA methylase [Macrococcus hajekii]GGB02624.1 hypothetical protein GCM10007190_08240 [Macrococcus hajekii]
MKSIQINESTAARLMRGLQGDTDANDWFNELSDREVVELFDECAAAGFYETTFFKEGEKIAIALFKALGSGGDVLDIGSGSGHFIRHAGIGTSYKGEEIDERQVKLSRQLIEKAGIRHAEIEQVDALLNFGSRHYDQVFCNMPFISRIDKRYFQSLSELSDYQVETRSLPDWLFAIRVVESLKERGIGIAIMRLNSLNSVKDREIREQMIKGGHIRAVIALPGQLSRFTTAEMAVVVFDKGYGGAVSFVDASEMWTKTESRHYRQLAASQIETIVQSVLSGSDISVSATLQQIDGQHYQMSPHLYLSAGHDSGHRLEDVALVYRGRDMTKKELDEEGQKEQAGYLLNLSELQDSYIGQMKQGLSAEMVQNREKLKLITGDILLTARGSTLKIAMVAEQISAGHVIPSSNIMVIRCHSIDPYFVFAYLNSHEGRARLTHMQTGSSLFVLSLKNMQQLMIPYENKNVAVQMHKELSAYQTLMKQVEQYHQQLPDIYDDFQ